MPPRVITAAKKAKIGAPNFYNPTSDSWAKSSVRAVTAGQNKGLIYDFDYGLVSENAQDIAEFIEANKLQPLPAGWREMAVSSPTAAVAPTTAATGTVVSAGSSGPRTKVPRSASSAEFLEKVRAGLAKLNPGKFLNLSSMYQVASTGKNRIYNHGLRLAADIKDKVLLAETVMALGGSPGGAMGEVDAASAASAASGTVNGNPGAIASSAAASSSGAAPRSAPRSVSTTLGGRKIWGDAATIAEVKAQGLQPAVATPVVNGEEVVGLQIKPPVAPTPEPLPFGKKTAIPSRFVLGSAF